MKLNLATIFKSYPQLHENGLNISYLPSSLDDRARSKHLLESRAALVRAEQSISMISESLSHAQKSGSANYGTSCSELRRLFVRLIGTSFKVGHVIAGAVAAGFTIYPAKSGRDAFLNISQRSIERLQQAALQAEQDDEALSQA